MKVQIQGTIKQGMSKNNDVDIEKIKNIVTPKIGGRRPKTQATNKLRFNMKDAMIPRFKENVVVSVEDSYDEEDSESIRAYQQERKQQENKSVSFP